MCDPPRIYPSLPAYTCTPLFNKILFICATLPAYTPLFNKFNRATPPPPKKKIYPPFRYLLKCLRIPESTPPSQKIPPFLTNLYVRPSQNLPLPPRITTLFNQFICATLPESTPPSLHIHVLPFLTNLYVRPSQNPPLPHRIYPPFSTNVYV